MRKLALLVATVGGVGYSPYASGTMGSLAALPLVLWLADIRGTSTVAYGAAVLAVVAAAIWSAGRADRALGEHDSGKIVIDEVAGMVVTGLFLPPGGRALLVGFAAFRVFDIVKPFPAGYFDRDVGGGLGVVADDLIAGAYAGIATQLGFRLLGAA
jgi:phosphatidylglycerophosphatase A